MRCTETAQITVADIMFPSGKLRREVSLRAAITKGCKQRCVYISSQKLIAALRVALRYPRSFAIASSAGKPSALTNSRWLASCLSASCWS